jgi:hypothetical protein
VGERHARRARPAIPHPDVLPRDEKPGHFFFSLLRRSNRVARQRDVILWRGPEPAKNGEIVI